MTCFFFLVRGPFILFSDGHIPKSHRRMFLRAAGFFRCFADIKELMTSLTVTTPAACPFVSQLPKTNRIFPLRRDKSFL